MATHSIPRDCTRINLMVLEREKKLLGQSAFANGFRSTSEYIRYLIDLGIEVQDKQLSQKYRAARASRFSRAVSLIVIGFTVIFQSLTGDITPRRPSMFRQPVTVRREAV